MRARSAAEAVVSPADVLCPSTSFAFGSARSFRVTTPTTYTVTGEQGV